VEDNHSANPETEEKTIIRGCHEIFWSAIHRNPANSSAVIGAKEPPIVYNKPVDWGVGNGEHLGPLNWE
jgi:hypothetical protein